MDVGLIQVPYTIGGEQHGASKGAQSLVEAGAEELIKAHGVGVTVERVERGRPFGDSASASLAVNRQLRKVVGRTAGAGRLPLVIAGSCDACLGVVAGFEHEACAVVWVDAHADFNTPESTVSGFFPGMSLAILAGHCYRNFWAEIGDNTPVREDATLLVGVRDLSPLEERQRLETSAIGVVEWRDGKPQGDTAAAVRELAARAEDVYLHVDLDGLDPEVAPGIVDAPVPGGLSLGELEELIGAVTESFRLRAVAITTFNPELDEDERTLRAALRVLELVADYAGNRAE